jgi:hypothetical protein
MKKKVAELREKQDNPRIIDTHKYETLKKSLQEFPDMLELRPIIVDDEGLILAGNMRYKACVELGYKEVPVKVLTGLSDDQKREVVIKDNLSYGEWDTKLIADMFPSFDDWTGKQTFDYSILDDFEDLDDEVEGYESNVKKAFWVKVPGDPDYIKKLDKHFRERNIYVGGLLLDKMRNVKRGYEKD